MSLSARATSLSTGWITSISKPATGTGFGQPAAIELNPNGRARGCRVLRDGDHRSRRANSRARQFQCEKRILRIRSPVGRAIDARGGLVTSLGRIRLPTRESNSARNSSTRERGQNRAETGSSGVLRDLTDSLTIVPTMTPGVSLTRLESPRRRSRNRTRRRQSCCPTDSVTNWKSGSSRKGSKSCSSAINRCSSGSIRSERPRYSKARDLFPASE